MLRFQQVESVDALRDFVNTTICNHGQLQEGVFSLTERILYRAFFCLHGPRATKFTAIWETDRNQILFYDVRGQRFLKIQLMEAPALESAAA
jgi:hypothetical protein